MRSAWQLAVSLALVQTTPAAAQDGQFDLRTRATPTPAPASPVVGPSDPDNPTVRPRPRASEAAPPPLVLPSVAPTPTASATATPAPNAERPTVAQRGPVTRATLSAPQPPAPGPATVAATATASAPAAATPAPGRYEPRRLDVVAPSGLPGWWLALGALAAALAIGGWLAWSRYFRHRARAVPAPEVERPHFAPSAAPQAPAVQAPSQAAPALSLALQATRMSATLINTTLSYRLAVTNGGAEPLSDVRIAGDMIAAHASRSAELLAAGVLPELHRIPALAPGESVTLSGDIRLPLVSITPIRRGSAAFFVPLARLRAQGRTPGGIAVEGGGTFLVGQEPGASKRLQPFRLDLGPRNYSRLSQQLLPAA